MGVSTGQVARTSASQALFARVVVPPDKQSNYIRRITFEYLSDPSNVPPVMAMTPKKETDYEA